MTNLVPMSAAPAVTQTGGGLSLRPGALSQRAKAAIVVRLLLNEAADILLGDLPEELHAQLTKAKGAMLVMCRAFRMMLTKPP